MRVRRAPAPCRALVYVVNLPGHAWRAPGRGQGPSLVPFPMRRSTRTRTRTGSGGESIVSLFGV
jgi:hypothetical protein